MFKVKRFLAIILPIVVLLSLIPRIAFGYDTGAGSDGCNIVEGKPVHQHITKEAIKVWGDAPQAAILEFKEFSRRDLTDRIDKAGNVNYNERNRRAIDCLSLGTTKADDLISGAAEEDSVKLFADVKEKCQDEDEGLNGFFEHFWDPDIPHAGGYDCGSIGGWYNFGLPYPEYWAGLYFSDSYSELYFNYAKTFHTYDSAYRLAEYYFEKATNLYKAGDKRQAYYWLGRIAHLLQDMTIPAHVHTRYHDPFVNDASDWFEDYASVVFSGFTGDQYAGKYYKYENLIPNFQWDTVHDQTDPPDLFKLFWYTAQKTQYFGSASSKGEGFVDEPTSGINWVFGNSYYRSRTNPFVEQPFNPSLWEGEKVTIVDDPNQLKENRYYLAHALIPHALKATAGLYRLFWHTVNDTIDIPLQNGVPYNDNVSLNQWKYYYIDVPSGASKLEFKLTNLTNDVNLYTQYNTKPTLTSYSCRPYFGRTTSETCTHNNPSAGKWWAGVYGYIAGSYTITATITTATGGTIQVNATLNGSPWSGSASYRLTGPQTIDGATVPQTFTNRPTGSYTLSYLSGGPTRATLSSITPSTNQTLSTGGTITFTLNFTSSTGITVTSPNGGENWPIGSSQTIRWTSSGASRGVTGNVRIDLSRNGGSTWETLFPNTANDGSEVWSTVTGTATTQARIRVVRLNNTAIWDMSDANFTITAPITSITVTKSGTGSGTVTSSPAGINCGTTCTASFNQGTTVTLTASPASGSTFGGWSGACGGTGTCTVLMDANKAVTATFTASITWSKTYGGSNSDSPSTILQAPDGGYLVVGYTRSFSIGGTGWDDILIMKTSSNGSIQWQKVYGGPGEDEAYSVKQTSDGGYILAGRYNYVYPDPNYSYGNDGWLLKLDSNGNIQWQKTIGWYDFDYFTSVTQTSDNGYIVTGYLQSGSYYSRSVRISKLDTNGNVQWQKSYKDILHSEKIFETSDNGYIVFGSDWVMRIDANGNVLWTKRYDFTDMEGFSDIQKTLDGGYIATGNSGCYGCGYAIPWLAKLDSNGNIMWRKGSSHVGNWNNLIQTNDGGYKVIGYQGDHNTGTYVAWAIKFDTNGNIQWQKIYGSVRSSLYTIQQTSDGGYIVAGVDLSGNGEIWLLKIDADGNMSGCPSGLINSSNTSVSDFTASATTSINVTATDTNLIPQTPTVNEAITDINPQGVCTGTLNQNPVISSVIANPSIVYSAGQTSTVTCNASDPDGDPLTYSWTTMAN